MTRPGDIRVILAAAVGLLLLPVLLIAAATGLTGRSASCAAQPAPAPFARTIPARYLALYRHAGTRYGVPWEILAGIGEVESDHGRSAAPGVHSGANPAGAAGPMQFGTGGTAGNTWSGPPVHPATQNVTGYGIDGDHDGIVNVYDPGDAIPAAARYVDANDAPGGIQAALFAYNHATWYVTAVLHWAARYAADGSQAVVTTAGPGCGPGPAGRCRPGPPGRSSPTRGPSSASPTSGAAPDRTPSTAQDWP